MGEIPGVEEIEFKMLSSVQGKLKMRCVVNPINRAQQNFNDQRLKELLSSENCSKMLTQEVSKMLKRERCMLPKYGLQVTVRRGRQDPSNRAQTQSATQLPAVAAAKPKAKR